jgi:putative membrane protein
MSQQRFSKSMIPIAFATLGLAGTASAHHVEQAPQQKQQQAQQQQHKIEKQGLAQLHAVNQGATDLGLIGINRAENDDVRDFAGKIVEEHQESDRELMKKAQELNLEIAGTREARQIQQKMEQRHKKDIEGLERVRGAQFDRQYMELVVQTHRQAVDQLRQQRQQVRNEDVQKAMDERLEKVQEHLVRAQELQREVAQERPS